MATVFPPDFDVPKAEQPLKVAIVYSRAPLPMRRADQLTVAHLIAFLSARGHIVDLYVIDTGGFKRMEPSELQWLRDRCRHVHTYKHSLYSVLYGILGVIRGIPLQVCLFTNPIQMSQVREAAASKDYDIIYTYYFRSAEITRGLSATRNASGRRNITFLAMQLSQSLNTSRIAANAPNFALKLLYAMERRLVSRYEAKIWKEFDKTVLISEADVAAITNVCRLHGEKEISNYIFGAHGTDVKKFTPRTDIVERPAHLVFSGVMRTPTNVQAVQWFAQHVWSLVKAQIPEATWDIVGREPSPEVLALGDLPGVKVTGTVADPAVHIASAAVCINPMQAGGGMQNKLLEYLGSGKAVVATSVANEGIGASNFNHLLIADQPAQFAEQVLNLLNDEALRRRLGDSARKFVLDEWTWEHHFLKLEHNFYQALSAADPN